MNLLENAVVQEQRRIEYMIKKYETELTTLPKGALIAKMIKGNQYYYLQYRSGKKTISKLCRETQEIKLKKLQQQIERRRHIQVMLKALSEEYAITQKMMEVCV